MKMFNFDSEEDAEDVNIPSTEMMDMSMCRCRCEVETDVDVGLLPWWTTHIYADLEILVKRYPYNPAATVACQRLFSLEEHWQ